MKTFLDDLKALAAKRREKNFLKERQERFKDTIINKYQWTWHAREKIRFYNLSPSRVTRIIRFPARVEDGVAPNTIAGMQPAGTKKYQEIWVMWQTVKSKVKSQKSKFLNSGLNSGTIKIISAWRYPGKSPARNPIPREILDEVRGLLS